MILWNIAGAIFLFRWIFRDPKVDIRLLALGALVPDVVDFVVGLFVGGVTVERVGHGLMLPALGGSALLITTRRGRRRRQIMTVLVAWLFHLVLDGVWLDGEVFLWPFLGWDVAPPLSGSVWSRAAEPWRWLKEAVALAYLLWLRSTRWT